jgi:NAD-dependent protein deacetylase/lipoamidase
MTAIMASGQPQEEQISLARKAIAASRRPVVFTGAGVSADSGIPTFRSPSGESFWGQYSPQMLATPEGFAQDPKFVYEWYSWRRRQLATVGPNAAHRAIAALQESHHAVVITQNIDALHERVAPQGATVWAVHGTMARDRCSDCAHREPVDIAAPPELRKCEECGAWMRPDVVWFGEMLDEYIWSSAARAAGDCDLMLVVGTSGEVYPAAGLVHIAAKRATVIVVNLDPGELDEAADISLHGKAADLVPQIIG